MGKMVKFKVVLKICMINFVHIQDTCNEGLNGFKNSLITLL